jgi:hypothetical protein
LGEVILAGVLRHCGRPRCMPPMHRCNRIIVVSSRTMKVTILDYHGEPVFCVTRKMWLRQCRHSSRRRVRLQAYTYPCRATIR